VAEESRAVRDGVGLIETTNFAKHEFTGPDARGCLERLLANRLPATGRMALAPMLSEQGRLVGDFTVAALPPSSPDDGPERFLVFGSGAAERYHARWFDAHLPRDGSVRYRTLGPAHTGLSIAGPGSRDLLRELSSEDVSNEAFGFLDVRHVDVGMVPALVGRISFTGDLGYELWVEPAYQARLFDDLMAAGARHGLRLFGASALNSLRLEKSFGSWATEFRPSYTPYEAGLGVFVKPDKGDFVGRDAVRRLRDEPPAQRLVTFTVDVPEGPAAADVIGDEPIWHEGRVVGRVTSGGYAHASSASVALGYVPADLATARSGFEVEVLGDRRAATRLDECLFDPAGRRMRG
jgi:dimethylglycine dehydrogenase